MNPLIWAVPVILGAVAITKKRPVMRRVLFDVTKGGGYSSPNGERTELDVDNKYIIDALADQLDGVLSWSAPNTLALLTSSNDYYKDQLIPVEQGQLVVRGVEVVT